MRTWPRPIREAIRRLGIVVSAAAITGGVACGRPAAGLDAAGSGATPGERPAAVPGIVLVCVDTLRADAVDGSADSTQAMPALGAFARSSTAFSDATASSSWTAPSVATLLSGLEVSRTGAEGDWADAGPMLPSVATLAEILREHGWSTHAVTAGGWFVQRRGYAQGFESFETSFDEAGPEAAVRGWQQRRAMDRPFLLLLHTCAAHEPYGEKASSKSAGERMPALRAEARRTLAGVDLDAPSLPEPVALWLADRFLFDPPARVATEQVMGPRAYRTWDCLRRWLDEDRPASPPIDDLFQRARKAYRGGLSFADDVLARTLAALDAARLPPETVVLIVGDHGEGLGEHGRLLHGTWLHDEMVRVPLLVRAPGRLPAGTRISGSCGLGDVMPTLLDLAGVPAPDGLDGRSLLPLARGDEAGHPVVSEVDREVSTAAPRRVLRLLSARTETAKYVVTFDRASRQVESEVLFDLRNDPGERAPIVPAPEATGRYGDDFCRTVSRLRGEALGSHERSPCGATVR